MSFNENFSQNDKTANEMSLKEAWFKRKKVSCDTWKIKRVITSWMRSEYWRFKDFGTFIELVGIKTPVRLSDLDFDYVEEKFYSMKCMTASNEEYTIRLIFNSGDACFDDYSKISVIKGEEERTYNINTKKEKTVPEVTLKKQIIVREGKKLECYYKVLSCERTLTIDKKYMLHVNIFSGLHEKLNGDLEVLALRNCEQIEEYLLSLDNSLIIDQVYDQVIRLLQFSKKDIIHSHEIAFSYTEFVKTKEVLRSEILVKYGEMQEYAVCEGDETFFVSREGNWGWCLLQDSKIVRYISKNDRGIIMKLSSEVEVQDETLKRVKERISKLIMDSEKWYY